MTTDTATLSITHGVTLTASAVTIFVAVGAALWWAQRRQSQRLHDELLAVHQRLDQLRTEVGRAHMRDTFTNGAPSAREAPKHRKPRHLTPVRGITAFISVGLAALLSKWWLEPTRVVNASTVGGAAATAALTVGTVTAATPQPITTPLTPPTAVATDHATTAPAPAATRTPSDDEAAGPTPPPAVSTPTTTDNATPAASHDEDEPAPEQAPNNSRPEPTPPHSTGPPPANNDRGQRPTR